ncbi:MAG TPA: pyrroline-5-carboxylate reductase, partial [Xanthobacteraceae bacterium]|nr:pyrroline-5-carboxylate reductase [Xanthobacteraceae bacterium]
MTADVSAAASALDRFAGTLLLVGAGNMGKALLTGWIDLGLPPSSISVLQPEPTLQIADLVHCGLRLNPAPNELPQADVIVLAVKPQVAADVLPGVKPFAAPATLTLSIMAGRTLAFLAGGLPAGSAVVRAMPNTPAAIGRSMTVAVANAHITPDQRQTAQQLLAAIGVVEWVDDERLLDPVTAVSGSGPAYVFLLAESLARAGVAAGLPAELAARLARETVTGAAELLHRSPLDAETL